MPGSGTEVPTPLILASGLQHWLLCRVQFKRWKERVTLKWRNLTCTTSSNEFRQVYLCGLPPQNHNLNPIIRKTSDSPKLRVILQKYLTSTPQNCQGHQKQGKSEKPSEPREAQGDMKTKCNMVSWMVSWNRKKHIS